MNQKLTQEEKAGLLRQLKALFKTDPSHLWESFFYCEIGSTKTWLGAKIFIAYIKNTVQKKYHGIFQGFTRFDEFQRFKAFAEDFPPGEGVEKLVKKHPALQQKLNAMNGRVNTGQLKKFAYIFSRFQLGWQNPAKDVVEYKEIYGQAMGVEENKDSTPSSLAGGLAAPFASGLEESTKTPPASAESSPSITPAQSTPTTGETKISSETRIETTTKTTTEEPQKEEETAPERSILQTQEKQTETKEPVSSPEQKIETQAKEPAKLAETRPSVSANPKETFQYSGDGTRQLKGLGGPAHQVNRVSEEAKTTAQKSEEKEERGNYPYSEQPVDQTKQGSQQGEGSKKSKNPANWLLGVGGGVMSLCFYYLFF